MVVSNSCDYSCRFGVPINRRKNATWQRARFATEKKTKKQDWAVADGTFLPADDIYASRFDDERLASVSGRQCKNPCTGWINSPVVIGVAFYRCFRSRWRITASSSTPCRENACYVLDRVESILFEKRWKKRKREIEIRRWLRCKIFTISDTLNSRFAFQALISFSKFYFAIRLDFQLWI